MILFCSYQKVEFSFQELNGNQFLKSRENPKTIPMKTLCFKSYRYLFWDLCIFLWTIISLLTENTIFILIIYTLFLFYKIKRLFYSRFYSYLKSVATTVNTFFFLLQLICINYIWLIFMKIHAYGWIYYTQ